MRAWRVSGVLARGLAVGSAVGCAVGFGAGLGSGGAAWGQPLDLCRAWVTVQPEGQGPMVYDEARREVLLLSADNSCCSNPMTTWVLRGDRWRRVSSAEPFEPGPIPFRSGAYDAGRQVVVAAGQYGDELRMAEWDGVRWRVRLNVMRGVLDARVEVVYDRARGELLVLVLTPGNLRVLAWDGSAFTTRFAGPVELGWLSAAYDAARARVVLYDDSVTWLGASRTYEWDGSTVSLRHAGPVEPDTKGMFYDPTVGAVRRSYDQFLTTWTGDGWTAPIAVPEASPNGGRGTFASCVFDPDRGSIISVRGYLGWGSPGVSQTASTYTFDGTSWSALGDWWQRSPWADDEGFYDEGAAVGVLLGDRDQGSPTRTWDGERYGDLPGYDVRPKLALPLCIHPDGVRAGQFIPNATAWMYDGGSWTSRIIDQFGGSTDYAVVRDPDRGVVWALGARITGIYRFASFDGRAWTGLPNTVPGNRVKVGATYDTVRRQVLVFGGQGTGVNQQLLAWDGSAWTQIFNGGPALRVSPAFVFDEARGVAVLFGGRGRSDLSDTWEWDGSAWRQVATAHAPAAGALTSWAYDAGTARVLVATNPAAGPSELWAYDGTDWAPLSSAPGLIVGMTYHPGDGVVLAQVKTAGEMALATFTWDGSAWTRVTRPSPKSFAAARAVYDAARGKSVVLTLESSAGFHGELWEHDGSAWTLRPEAGPEARYRPAVAYDRARGRVVLFGGQGYTVATGPYLLGDTWEWDGAAWSLVSQSGPSPRQARMAYDERRGVCVLFGGRTSLSSSVLSTETWEWDGSAWRPGASGAETPEARDEQAMAFDPASGRMLMFGGLHASGASAEDTWAYDGASWRPVDSPSGFSYLFGPGAFFDRGRGALVNVVNDNQMSWTLRELVPERPRVDGEATDVREYQGRTVVVEGLIRGEGAPELRWYHDGALVSDGGRVSGARTGRLVIEAAERGDSGLYELVATACGGEARTAARVEVRCLADFNEDGFVDFFDYDAFLACFEDGLCPTGGNADMNGDAFADFFDYDEFVAAFEAGC